MLIVVEESIKMIACKERQEDPVSNDSLLDRALEQYGLRVLDNIDLSKLPCSASRSRVVARALMERGDARAFAMGSELMAACRP